MASSSNVTVVLNGSSSQAGCLKLYVQGTLIQDRSDAGIAGCHVFGPGPTSWTWEIPVAAGGLAHFTLENMGQLTLTSGSVTYLPAPPWAPPPGTSTSSIPPGSYSTATQTFGQLFTTAPASAVTVHLAGSSTQAGCLKLYVNGTLVTDQNDAGIAGCHVFVGGPRYWDWSIPAGNGGPSRLALENMGNLTVTDGTVAYVPSAPPTPTPIPTPTPVPTPTPLPGSDPTLGTSWNGQYQGGLAPPDPTGAMGMDRYVEFINLRYGIYDRAGGLVAGSGAQGDLGAMTGLPVSELSDPQIVWDPESQRFYYSVLDVARMGLAFGYSTVPNPASPSDFCHYILDFGYANTLTLPDYPKMAVSSDYVLFGVNTFFFLSVYQGSDVDWVHKPTSSSCPATIDGGKFAALRNADGSYMSTPVPAVNADPSSTGWVVGSVDASTAGSGSVLSVFSVTKGGSGDPVLTGPMTIPVAPYSVPAAIPQAGTTATLDSLDSRLTHAVAAFDPRLGATAIWTSHAVFGGAGSEQRWYEIRTDGTPALAQSGVVTSPTAFVWNGAVSPNRANDGAGGAAYGSDMVLGFNTSSASSYPALQIVSKRGADGQSNWVLVTQATGPNVDSSCGPACRWGDYAGAVPDPDPNAGGQVWLSGEWNLPATNGTDNVWRTWNWAATP